MPNTLNRSTAKLITLSAILLKFCAASGQVTTVSTPGRADVVPDLRVIKMVDRLRGWTVAQSSLWVTSDGARTWKMISVGNPFFHNISSSLWGVLADGKAWAVVGNPFEEPHFELARISPDGQVEDLTLPCLGTPNCYPQAADFDRSGQKGLLFGSVPINGELERIVAFRTDDGARHWRKTKAPDATMLSRGGDLEVQMTGDRQALADIGCGLFMTSNFGESWNKVKYGQVASSLDDPDTTPCDIRFVGPLNGWLRTNTGWILHTVNGGKSWTISPVGPDNSFKSSWDEWVSFVDARHGLMVVSGRVLETRDAGQTWTPLTEPGEYFWCVSCAGGVCILRSENRVARYTFDK